MAAAWKGAIEFGGFPVNVALYNRVKSRSANSFKSLAPTDKLPVRSVYLDSSDNEVARADVLKGVKVEKDKYVALPDEAVEQIKAAEKSTIVAPDQFAPLDTIDLSIASSSFAVIPDKDVAGAEQSVNLMWNGLRETGLAYVSTVTMRAGSQDAIIAFYATDSDLRAVALPFSTELNDTPGFGFTEDAKAAGLFEQFVGANYEPAAFDHAALVSGYAERRESAIQAALQGKAIEAPATAAPEAAGPDLMGALEAAVKAGPAKKSGKAKAAKKPSGKRAKVAA